MNAAPAATRNGSSGLTLVEVLIALFVLAIGILGFARVYPAAMRTQGKNRMAATAGQFANEQFEALRGLPRTNALLSTGRHPTTGYEAVGATAAWQRYYIVTQMAAPLDSLLKVDVTVKWQSTKPESVRIAGYLFP